MLRFIGLAVIALALVAVVTRSRPLHRVLYVVFGLMVVYAVLKLAGVIDAIAPARDGVF